MCCSSCACASRAPEGLSPGPASGSRCGAETRETWSKVEAMSKRQRVAWVLERSGVGRLMRRLPVWQGVVVLNYHRIGDGSSSPLDRNLWSATPEELDEQVRFLVREFDLIGPPDFSPELLRRRGRRVMLTFDDGYPDNYD